jgi:hypothetical protein
VKVTSSVPFLLKIKVQKIAEKRKRRARERKTVGRGISPADKKLWPFFSTTKIAKLEVVIRSR